MRVFSLISLCALLFTSSAFAQEEDELVLTLDSDAFYLGVPLYFTVTGADPGERVNLYFSRRPGETCPADLSGACLAGVEPMPSVATTTADGEGIARLVSEGVVAATSAAALVFQAVVLRGPDTLVSNPLNGPARLARCDEGDLWDFANATCIAGDDLAEVYAAGFEAGWAESSAVCDESWDSDGDDIPNVCDTCEGAPDELDGDCDGVLIPEDCDDTDPEVDSPPNACGGCSPLGDWPGEACGTCDSGILVCSGDQERLFCVDDAGEAALNACGGCSELANEPDASCGPCGLDRYVCAPGDAEATICDGETVCSSGAVVFNSCGQTGPGGPTQEMCEAAYLGTDLDGGVTVVEGIQHWVAPVTGDYRIEAWGAQGGLHEGEMGGRGAHLAGTFRLDAGDGLQILVGQMGKDGDTYDYGGGGGTFVARVDDTPLLVAAGGGVAGNCGADAVIDVEQGSAAPGDGNGGAGGNDGFWCGCGGDGSPGGGFFTGGEGDGAGQAFIDGGRGAEGVRPGQCVDAGWGGFGGGGNSGNGGGGGGGYEGGYGGGSGAPDTTHRGSGGLSFNAGTDPLGLDGEHEGPGLVVISPL